MKALVVYGTRWGGTVDVAEKIGNSLRENSYDVDVVDARKRPPNIDRYDLVIVGSGIRADCWTKETLSFLERNAPLLKVRKTALFVSCQMADREKEARDKARAEYLVQVSLKYGLRPISYGFFGGFLDLTKSHGLLCDIMVRVNGKKLKKNGLDPTKIHDTRDWSEIVSWANGIAQLASDNLREPNPN